MSNVNDIRHGRHYVFLRHVPLAFVTGYRRNVFTKEKLDDLRDRFASVCADFEAEAAAVPPSKSSASTSNSSKRHINRPKDGYAVRAILPRPEGRGLPRTGVSRPHR